MSSVLAALRARGMTGRGGDGGDGAGAGAGGSAENRTASNPLHALTARRGGAAAAASAALVNPTWDPREGDALPSQTGEGSDYDDVFVKDWRQRHDSNKSRRPARKSNFTVFRSDALRRRPNHRVALAPTITQLLRCPADEESWDKLELVCCAIVSENVAS